MNTSSTTTESSQPEAFTPPLERGPRILARTFVRELQSQGFTDDQIKAFASEIIGMVTESASVVVIPAR